jgi:hypothetical protein
VRASSNKRELVVESPMSEARMRETFASLFTETANTRSSAMLAL